MDSFNTNQLYLNSHAMRRMASLKVDLSSPIHSFMKDILTTAQNALGVSRITVWILNEDCLRCVANTDWVSAAVPDVLPILKQADYPKYFQAIKFGETIAAHNAEHDSRTDEFTENYLKPQNIKSMLDTIIFENGEPAGVVCCEHRENKRNWRANEIQFTEVLADCCSYRFKAKEQAILEEELKNMAFIDDLTQIYNRRFFFDSIGKVISLHARESTPLTLAMLDLDNFKAINDKYGHVAGDKVLKVFAQLTEDTIRNEDIFCRFGGEEFIILFQHKKAKEAFHVIERLRTNIEQQLITYEDIKFSFTFSAGLCEVKLDEPISISVKNADEALYKAKKSGKNKVEVNLIQ